MQPKTTLTPDSDIPDRLYFKIGDVADLVGVETHVLRYWEKELPSVRPTKSQTNQRRYRRRDVDLFRQIKRLLHEERYTLAGARKQLLGSGVVTPSSNAPQQKVENLDIQDPKAPSSDALGIARTQLHQLIRIAGEEP